MVTSSPPSQGTPARGRSNIARPVSGSSKNTVSLEKRKTSGVGLPPYRQPLPMKPAAKERLETGSRGQSKPPAGNVTGNIVHQMKKALSTCGSEHVVAGGGSKPPSERSTRQQSWHVSPDPRQRSHTVAGVGSAQVTSKTLQKPSTVAPATHTPDRPVSRRSSQEGRMGPPSLGKPERKGMPPAVIAAIMNQKSPPSTRTAPWSSRMTNTPPPRHPLGGLKPKSIRGGQPRRLPANGEIAACAEPEKNTPSVDPKALAASGSSDSVRTSSGSTSSFGSAVTSISSEEDLKQESRPREAAGPRDAGSDVEDWMEATCGSQGTVEDSVELDGVIVTRGASESSSMETVASSGGEGEDGDPREEWLQSVIVCSPDDFQSGWIPSDYMAMGEMNTLNSLPFPFTNSYNHITEEVTNEPTNSHPGNQAEVLQQVSQTDDADDTVQLERSELEQCATLSVIMGEQSMANGGLDFEWNYAAPMMSGTRPLANCTTPEGKESLGQIFEEFLVRKTSLLATHKRLPPISESLSSIGDDFLDSCTAVLGTIPEVTEHLTSRLQWQLSTLLDQLSDPGLSRLTLDNAEVQKMLASYRGGDLRSHMDNLARQAILTECTSLVLQDMRTVVEHNHQLRQGLMVANNKLQAMTDVQAHLMDTVNTQRATVEQLTEQLTDGRQALQEQREKNQETSMLMEQLAEVEEEVNQQKQLAQKVYAVFTERNAALMHFVKFDRGVKRNVLAREMQSCVTIKKLRQSERNSADIIARLKEEHALTVTKCKNFKMKLEKSTANYKQKIEYLNENIKMCEATEDENNARIAELVESHEKSEQASNERIANLESAFMETTNQCSIQENLRQQAEEALKVKEDQLTSTEAALQETIQSLEELRQSHPAPTPESSPGTQSSTALRDELQATRVRLEGTQQQVAGLRNERNRVVQQLAMIDEQLKCVTCEDRTKLDEMEGIISELQMENKDLHERLLHSTRQDGVQEQAAGEIDTKQNSDREEETLSELEKLRDQVLELQTSLVEHRIHQVEMEVRLEGCMSEADKKDIMIHEQTNALRTRDNLIAILRKQLDDKTVDPRGHGRVEDATAAPSNKKATRPKSRAASSTSSNQGGTKKPRAVDEDITDLDMKIADLKWKLLDAERGLKKSKLIN